MTSTAEIVFYPRRASTTNAKELIAKSAAAWNKHAGFIAAHHGPLVEDRRISCLVLEWSNKDALIGWTRNYNAEEVNESKALLVDSEAGLEPFATFVNFKHDPAASFQAPVTEFGFFSLPDQLATEQVVFEKVIGETDITQHPVITVGKATGAALGHVFAVKPEMASEEYTTAFAGVFGYKDIQDHWRWRETPEHTEVIKQMSPLVNELGLRAVDVLGRRRAMIEGTGIVHVEFEKIA